jgi:hypothetical protein
MVGRERERADRWAEETKKQRDRDDKKDPKESRAVQLVYYSCDIVVKAKYS